MMRRERERERAEGEGGETDPDERACGEANDGRGTRERLSRVRFISPRD